MATTSAIGSEKYIAFTTYRRTGEAVTSPVWVNPVSDGRIGFWTSMGTGKTKRLKNDPRVVVQPSDVRGRVGAGTSPLSGTAEMVRSGPLFDEVQREGHEKYRAMSRVTRVLAKLGPQGRQGLTYADTVVLVRLDD